MIIEMIAHFAPPWSESYKLIGEALMRLDDVKPDIAEQIPDYINIIGFRHVLVHSYDVLNPATVWNVIETKLLPLKDQLQRILKDLST
jgi:uncharacterized protein with HEPN domain